MNNSTKVSDLGEKKLIKRIIEKSKNFKIGDDAALVDFNSNNQNEFLVASSDMLIERFHFPKQMSYFQMGQKAVTVNVSDLAAMGAKPIGILISLAITNNLRLCYFDELIEGILSSCSFYNIPLIGGDTNQGDEIVISGTVLGIVEKEKALIKSNFKKEDLLAVTGTLGLAALGFEFFNLSSLLKKAEQGVNDKKFSQNIIDLAIEKALNPVAKLNEGLILRKFNSSLNSSNISATDITDGLASELYELINSNNISRDMGILIYEDKIPVNKELKKIADYLDLDFLKLILHTGEDFELLFTINKKHVHEMKKLLDFTIIGEITNNSKAEILLSNGNIKELSSKGYEHFF